MRFRLHLAVNSSLFTIRFSLFNFHFHLAFKYQRKHNHPGAEPVDAAGVFQIGVATVDIINAVTEFYFGGEYKYREVEIKANACFHAQVEFVQLHQVVGFSGGRVGGQIVFELGATKHVYPKISNPVAAEFKMYGQSQQDRFYPFGLYGIFPR
jgi:hypothetical protein